MLPILPSVFLAWCWIQCAAVVEWAFFRKDGTQILVRQDSKIIKSANDTEKTFRIYIIKLQSAYFMISLAQKTQPVKFPCFVQIAQFQYSTSLINQPSYSLMFIHLAFSTMIFFSRRLDTEVTREISLLSNSSSLRKKNHGWKCKVKTYESLMKT